MLSIRMEARKSDLGTELLGITVCRWKDPAAALGRWQRAQLC